MVIKLSLFQKNDVGYFQTEPFFCCLHMRFTLPFPKKNVRLNKIQRNNTATSDRHHYFDDAIPRFLQTFCL